MAVQDEKFFLELTNPAGLTVIDTIKINFL
jgi:hypothetical protein